MATGHNVSFHLGFPHENITLAEASLQNLQTSIFTPSNYNQNFQDRLQCQCSVPTVCCRSAVYMIHHLKKLNIFGKEVPLQTILGTEVPMSKANCLWPRWPQVSKFDWEYSGTETAYVLEGTAMELMIRAG